MEKVFAQSKVTMDTISVEGPKGLKFGTLTEIVAAAIPYIFAIAGVGMLLMIISAGFSLMTSAGDAKKMEKGKAQLTYAVVGFLIVFVAYWIIQFAGFAFGIEGITSIFGS